MAVKIPDGEDQPVDGKRSVIRLCDQLFSGHSISGDVGFPIFIRWCSHEKEPVAFPCHQGVTFLRPKYIKIRVQECCDVSHILMGICFLPARMYSALRG